ncbi:hypothetical protein CerSpe_193640 [Prunus speciosa]
MCSEASPPRLSFSLYLGQADVLPVGHNQPRRDTSLLDLNYDFEFSISGSFRHESSSADELFSHGVILPMQPRERVDEAPKRISNSEAGHSASLPPLPSPPSNENQKKERVKEVVMDMNSDHLELHKPPSKSFWGFKRSSSLNQDNKKSLLCSLPLLSRSNSTGSAPNPNPKKTTFKQSSSQKQSSNISMSKSFSYSSSSSSSSNPYATLPRPPSKKGYNGSSYYGNGVRISPVLNVPSPYISKGTAKLFCLGSFLHPGGKDKKAKK